MKETLARVQGAVKDPIEAMGFQLVRVQLSGKKRWKLQVMIERQDETPVTLDDCVAVSRQISYLLDVEDPIEGSYSLEVTSPGLDRPLMNKKDYQRFVGSEVKLQTHQPFDGRRKFKGTLISADDDHFALELEENEEVIEFSYDEVHHGNLAPKF